MADTAPVDGPITLINVFEIPAELVDDFVEKWQEGAAVMAAQPGFRDARLHKAVSSDSRFQLINVAHWDTQVHLTAALANPAFQNAVAANAHLPMSATPGVYRIAAELEPTHD